MSAQTHLSDGANDQLKNEGISNVNIDSELRDAGAISSCPTYKDDGAELRDCDESLEVHNKTVELTTVEVKNNQILEGIQNGTTSNITGEVPYESTEAMIKGSMNIDDASVSNCMTAASRNVGGSDSTYNLTKPNDTEIVSNDLYDKSRTQPDAYKIVFNEAEFSADKSIDTVILDEKDDSTISVECEITRRETPDGNEGSYPVLTESGEVNNFILNDNKSSTMSVEYENTSNVNKNNTIQDVPGVQIQNQNDRTKNQDRQYDTKSPGKNDIKGTGHRKQFEGTSKKLNGESTQNDNKQCNNSNTITETERILGDIASGALSGQRVDDDLTKGNKSETSKKMNDSDFRPIDQDKKSEIVASSWKKNTPNENVFQLRATASSLQRKIIRRTKSFTLKTKMPGENLPNSVGKEHSSEADELTTGTKVETLPKYESTDHLQNDRDDEPEIVVPLSERIKQNSKKDIYWSIDKLKNVTKKLDGITNWSNKVTPCPVHKDILSHWCSTCKTAKCEKCLNILYSKSCVDHSITTLENHVTMREKDYKVLIKEKSSLCLKVTDQTIENLSADYQNSELLALTQEERIKQEFISFHALLVEKENDILTDLRQSFEQYKVQNSMGQGRCGDFIVEEAELACKLDDKESNLLSKIKNMDTLMDKWSLLQKKTVSMAKIPFPSQLRVRFTLFQEKTYIQKHLSVFSDPLELHPTHSTVFLSGSTLESPLQVSDLFECKNSTYSFDDIEVDVEICQSRKLLQYLRLRMNEDVCNSIGRVHLIENTRYLVRARLVADGVMNDNLGKRFRNVFIVTGCRGKCNRTLSTTEVIHYMEKLRRKKNKDRCPKRKYILYKTGLKPLFYEWQKTGMWSLSCTRDCKDFFDISPEELRVLAYSVDKATYDSIVVCFEDDLKNHCQHFENSHFPAITYFSSIDFQVDHLM